MTDNSPCGCGCDHEEEKDAPVETPHECCGGHCHDGNEAADDHHCGCGHDHEHMPTISPEELEQLKKAITEAGYKIEETAEGEIKILEQ